MIISDLNYLEVVSQETEVQGAGYAEAFAEALAEAYGQDIAVSTTGTGTYVSSFPGSKIALSGSGSSSYAV
jgi:hypothetical protein